MFNVFGWSGEFSPHATRTTGSTRLNEMSFKADWIERQLAHTEPNASRRSYNHADYLEHRADKTRSVCLRFILAVAGHSNVVRADS